MLFSRASRRPPLVGWLLDEWDRPAGLRTMAAWAGIGKSTMARHRELLLGRALLLQDRIGRHLVPLVAEVGRRRLGHGRRDDGHHGRGRETERASAARDDAAGGAAGAPAVDNQLRLPVENPGPSPPEVSRWRDTVSRWRDSPRPPGPPHPSVSRGMYVLTSTVEVTGGAGAGENPSTSSTILSVGELARALRVSDRVAYLLTRCAERSPAWREELGRPWARRELAAIAATDPEAFARALGQVYEDPERVRQPRAWLARTVARMSREEAG